MPYNTFAVAGSGGLGAFIIKALSDRGADIVVLSRSKDAQVPAGVQVKVVDYESQDSLKEVLTGIDVVISALSGPGFAAQPALFKAAKAQGAKLAVPSEFGNRTSALTDESPIYFKKQMQDLLTAIGLDFTLIWNGPFLDTTFTPLLGFHWAEGKVDLIGEGTNPIPLTTREDIGRFLAHVLTTASHENLANKALTIQGDTYSFNDAIKLYEESHNTKITVNRTSRSDTEAYIKANPGFASFLEYLKLSWDVDPAPKESDTAHHLFPDWNPTKAEEVIKAL